MTHHLLRRFVLVVGFILLAAMFLLVLTLNAMRVPTTVSTTLPEGPYLVKDIMPDEAHSYPAPIIPAGERAYFFAYDDQGRNLWISDGTEAGTHQVKDLNELTGAVTNPPKPFFYPTPIHGYDYPETVNDKLFFANDDGLHGNELWISDGSMTGTMMVKDIYSDTSSSRPYLFTNVNDQLLFRANDNIHGTDLWVSDGTVTKTNIVKDIEGVDYLGMINMNDKAYFAGNDGVHGYELWSSDGTEEGTYMVKDIRPDSDSSGPNLFYATDTHIFFFAYLPGQPRLWQSDGTFTGTIPVQDTITGTTFSAIIYQNRQMTTRKAIFFTAADQLHSRALWISDGTIAGTHFVKDISPSFYHPMETVDDRIFFFAYEEDYGSELWVSDGTSDGTFMVKDINLGTLSSNCAFFGYEPMANLNGVLFFTANDGEHGCELWLSDGTEVGTYMVEDINLGASDSDPEYLAATDNTLFFMADDGVHGSELWSLGNMAPLVQDDTAVTSMNHPITIPVITNDFDVNLDEFTISAVDDPTNGTATIDGQTIVYTPDDAFIGGESFSYTVQENGGGLTAVAQINITVTGYRTYLPTILHQTGDR